MRIGKPPRILGRLWLGSTILAVLLPVWAEAQDADPGISPNAGFYVSEFAPGSGRSWRPEADWTTSGLQRPMVILEVSRFADQPTPTPEQATAANDLLESTLEAVTEKGWFDFDQARNDGFQPMFGDPLHFPNLEFILDDRVLDPARPEFLMFYDTESGKKLVGVMFLVREPAERGPQVGGPLTLWHYHTWRQPLCLLNRLLVVTEPDENGACLIGEAALRSPEMMHVWFVEHPLGPFSTQMGLPADLLRQIGAGESGRP